jgi:hypothetical protein
MASVASTTPEPPATRAGASALDSGGPFESRSWLFGLMLVTLAFKLWLSAALPVTGDEAYFMYWGFVPALGYYDHPPMVGWMFALFSLVSDAGWWLRLPVTIIPAFIALAIYAVIRRRNIADAEPRAVLAALGLLLAPPEVWNIFGTTDAPLAFWSFLSGLAFWRAVERRSQGWFAIAGALLGLAFLSKYFAVLLGIAYLAYMLLSPRDERQWRGLLVAFAAALPFVAFNLYWNYLNCWANLEFNLYNRHDDAGLSWKTPLLFAITVLYLLSPVALFALARLPGGLSGLRQRLREDVSVRVLLVLAGVPFALFAVLSLVKEIGLHWPLSFLPFFYAACALLLPRRALRRSAMFLAVFGAVHIIGVVAVSRLPLETWKSSRLYDGIVFHVRINEILDQIRPYAGEYDIAADGYSAAITSSYYRMREAEQTGDARAIHAAMAEGRPPYVFVFGEASSHARHDDLVTDFRRFAGHNILVLRKSPPEDADYKPYFASVQYRDFDVAGARYWLVLGRNFNYPAYRAAVLDKVRMRYYGVPRYLPQGQCVFCQRYADSGDCPGR